MKAITRIYSNGSKWAGEAPDSLIMLLNRLTFHPIDSWFTYFRCESPDPDGFVRFFGNFEDLSAVFNLSTNDPRLIAELRLAIAFNIDWRD